MSRRKKKQWQTDGSQSECVSGKTNILNGYGSVDDPVVLSGRMMHFLLFDGLTSKFPDTPSCISPFAVI